MFVLLCALLCLCCYKMQFSSFHSDYLVKEQTTAIKGIFAAIILLSHMKGYMHLSGKWDAFYLMINSFIDQLMVAMFFFYSGYGVMEAWKRKPGYEKSFLKNRFFKVLLHFNCALILFALMNLILGIRHTPEAVLLCWTGWTSIGNSNWFIFDMLVFYLLTWVSMVICRNRKKRDYLHCLLTSILCFLFWVVMIKGGKESWWWNTIWCYPVGLWYSLFKKPIEQIGKKNSLWLPLMIVAFCVFLILRYCGGAVLYDLCAVLFCLLIVGFTMKVKIGNPVLDWLGIHSFSIYILQRIPMILFYHFGWNENKWIFMLLTIPSVMLLAFVFEKNLKWLDQQLFGSGSTA